MTIEDKRLLIQDISARLPYAVKVEHSSGFIGVLLDMTVHPLYGDDDKGDEIVDYLCYTQFFGDEDLIDIKTFKPYLFPLTSMNEEQKGELSKLTDGKITHEGLTYEEGGTLDEYEVLFSYSLMCNVIGWLNKNHFDYRGLIEKGLAIDATGKNIYP